MCNNWCHLDCCGESNDISMSNIDWICAQCHMAELPGYDDGVEQNEPEIERRDVTATVNEENNKLTVESQLQTLKSEKGLKLSAID